MIRTLEATLTGASSLNQLFLEFIYLQILDLMTTVAFLVHGVEEGNPVVRLACSIAHNPIGGLLAVKVVAVVLGIYCWRVRRQRLLLRINVMFALVIAWNLVAIIVSPFLSKAL